MITIATNENNDIYLGADGNLVLLSGLDAVLQSCEHAMKGVRGEMVYQVQAGVPYFETVWDQKNIPLFESDSVVEILAVPDVIRVNRFDTVQVGDVLQYEVEIVTQYGQGVISGEL